MESVFLVNKFEDGWDIIDLESDIYTQEEYCVDVLEIPDEKIYGTEMIGIGLLEIVLTDIEEPELEEDWYINLHRISA